jgi:DNA polymerase-3 subunit beta
MKTKVNRKALEAALSAAKRHSGRTIPVLENVLIQADPDNGLMISATNLETGIMFLISGAETDKPWATTLPPASMLDTLKLQDKDEVVLTYRPKTEKVELKATSKATFKCLPAAEHPGMPDLIKETGADLTLPVELFKQAVSFAITSVAKKGVDMRPALGAVLVDGTDTGFNIVCADGFRLSAWLDSDYPIPETRVVIPAKAMQEGLRSFSEGDVHIQITANQSIMRCGNVQVVSQKVQSNFPEWEKIVVDPKTTTAIKMSASEAALALRQAKILAPNNYLVRLTFSNKKMVVSAVSTVGSTKMNVGVKEGDASMQIGFNVDMLADALGTVKDEVTLYVKDSQSPVRMQNGNDQAYHIIMPMYLPKDLVADEVPD